MRDSWLFSDSSISSTEAPTAKGMSFFTVERLMVIGATMAAQPTMSMAFIVFEPTTLPTAMSGVPFKADTKLTNSSGADVPAATMVSPMIISGTFMRRANADAPSVRRSAPMSTMATPTIINRTSSIMVLSIFYSFIIIAVVPVEVVEEVAFHSRADKLVEGTPLLLRGAAGAALAVYEAADAVHLQ